MGRLNISFNSLAEHAAMALCAKTQFDGVWSDFNLSTGSSDIWVTAYALQALAEIENSGLDCKNILERDQLQEFGNKLSQRAKPCGGYAYNDQCQVDADSTAIALRAFTALSIPTPKGLIRHLKAHILPGTEGVRTYLRDDPKDRWGWAHPDVGCMVILALLQAGKITRETAATYLVKMQSKWLRKSGVISGFWWAKPAYPTLCQAELCHALGISIPPITPEHYQSCSNIFELSSWALTAALAGQNKMRQDCWQGIANQLSWYQGQLICPAHARLQAPASHLGVGQVDEYSVDLHGVFSLGTLLRALAFEIKSGRGNEQIEITKVGAIRALDISDLEMENCCKSIEPDYCSLASGHPVEYSFRLNEMNNAWNEKSHRFTTHIGPLKWPAKQRFQRTIEQVAALKNVPTAFEQHKGKFISRLQSLTSEVPKLRDPRFMLWLGLDSSHQAPNSNTLKFYLNGELFGSRSGRLNKVQTWLKGIIPDYTTKGLHDVVSFLESAGFLQEIGVGFRGSKIFVKFYWEFTNSHPHQFEDVKNLLWGITPDRPAGSHLFESYMHRAEACILRSGVAATFDANGAFTHQLTFAQTLPKRLSRCSDFGLKKLPALLYPESLQPTLITRTIQKESEYDTLYARPTQSYA